MCEGALNNIYPQTPRILTCRGRTPWFWNSWTSHCTVTEYWNVIVHDCPLSLVAYSNFMYRCWSRLILTYAWHSIRGKECRFCLLKIIRNLVANYYFVLINCFILLYHKYYYSDNILSGTCCIPALWLRTQYFNCDIWY